MCICGEFYCTTLFQTNLQLKYIKFLSRLMVTMLCRIRHAETGFNTSKIILNLWIKNVLARGKKLEDKELEEILDEDRSQTLAELGNNITSWLVNCFKTFESVRNDPQARTLGADWVEAKKRRTAFYHVWTTASTAEKKRFFCIVTWLGMNSGYTTIIQSVENCR